MAPDSIQFAYQLAYGEGVPSPEVWEWVRQGFRRYLAHGDLCDNAARDSLPVAFHLDASSRLRMRNTHLVRAAEILADGRGLTSWELAGLLYDAIERFENLHLGFITRDPRKELTPLNDELRWAYLTGATWPRTRETLNTLLKNASNNFRTKTLR